MKISLVTVCYNSRRTLPAAFESVLAQRGADYEYIVVDGASGDGTPGLLREWEPRFAGRMRWTSEPDAGIYDAMNKGIARATGDAVGILNADDFFDSDHVLADVAEALGDPAVDAVYGDIRFVPAAGPERTVRYYSSRGWRPWMHNWGFMPAHPSLYVRRRFFSELGAYDPGYRISADFELMVRFLCRARLRARYLPECFVAMRTGGRSTKDWRANVLLNRENVRANRANGYFSCMAMMLPKYAFKIWGFVTPRFSRSRG